MYDQVLAFQAEVRTDDSHGGASVTWETRFRNRAQVQAIEGRELVEAQGLEQITTHRIRMRHHWRNPVDTSMRIVWETNHDKILNIVSAPDPGPRSMTREIIGQEGGAI